MQSLIFSKIAGLLQIEFSKVPLRNLMLNLSFCVLLYLIGLLIDLEHSTQFLNKIEIKRERVCVLCVCVHEREGEK